MAQDDLLARTQALDIALTSLILALERIHPGTAASTADGIDRYLTQLGDAAVDTSGILRAMVVELRGFSGKP